MLYSSEILCSISYLGFFPPKPEKPKPTTHFAPKKFQLLSHATFQLLVHHTCKTLSSLVLSLRSSSYSLLQVLRISSFSLTSLFCCSFHFCWAVWNAVSVSATFCWSFSFNTIVYRKKERKKTNSTAKHVQKKKCMMIISSSVYCDILWNTGKTSNTGEYHLHYKETIKFCVPTVSFTQGYSDALEIFRKGML